jgi:hypothetical protein
MSGMSTVLHSSAVIRQECIRTQGFFSFSNLFFQTARVLTLKLRARTRLKLKDRVCAGRSSRLWVRIEDCLKSKSKKDHIRTEITAASVGPVQFQQATEARRLNVLASGSYISWRVAALIFLVFFYGI